MPEAVTTAPAPAAAPVAISTQQGAAMLAERRAANAAEQNKPNPSEAARILNAAKAAKALQRTTEAAEQVQEPADEAEGSNVADDQTQLGEAQDAETANADTPEVTQAEDQDDPDSRTIDLGDGVSMTAAEVRESILLKADHTRRLQALAEERKQLESERTQKLSQLDKLIASLEPMKGQTKTRAQFIEEFGYSEGLDKWDEHISRVNAARQLAEHTRTKAQQEARIKAEQECDQFLVENHNKEWADQKRYEAAQVEITKYAKSLGFTSEQIYGLGVIPGALIALDKARQFDALKENSGKITRTIADKPKVVKPGAKVSAQAGAQSAAAAAKAKAQSSGSLADAVKYLQAQRTTRPG